MSGLSRTPGKRVRGKTLRGFESRLLRQKKTMSRPSISIQHVQEGPLTGAFFDVRGIRALPDLSRVATMAPMSARRPSFSDEDETLDRTLAKNEKVAADVQGASDQLAVVATVLEQELPDSVQVGEVAQAIEHASQLEKQLARSAQALTEVNEALATEIERRNG